jgi:hypothetical protein
MQPFPLNGISKSLINGAHCHLHVRMAHSASQSNASSRNACKADKQNPMDLHGLATVKEEISSIHVAGKRKYAVFIHSTQPFPVTQKLHQN